MDSTAVMLVAPTKTLLNYKSPSAGRDMFDHTLVLLTKDGPLIAFPCLNVDPSVTAGQWPAIAHGLYGVWKARHHYTKKDESNGFFITQVSVDLMKKNPHWSFIHSSPQGIRQGLPSRDGKSLCDWINIHAAGSALAAPNSDWSEGCFTLPYKYFEALYSSYPDHTPGLLSYAESFDVAFKNLIAQWPVGIPRDAIANFKEV